MELVPVVDEGLGNSSYLLDLGDGRAAVIDPERDPRPYLERARARGLQIAFAVETHVHADFVTSTRELAATGAQVVAAAAAGLGFEHRGLGDGDRLALGALSLEAVATPGHTPEAPGVAAARRAREPGGGVQRWGAGGRRDGADRSERRRAHRAAHARGVPLAARSPAVPARRAAGLAHPWARVVLLDRRGRGRTSTIGAERAGNPLLAGDPDEDELVARLLAGYGSYPAYFDRLPRYNRAGPRVLGDPPLAALDVATVAEHVHTGGQLVDARPVAHFAAGHIPGAISNELRAQFGTWLGWVIDPDRPVVFVVDNDQDSRDLLRQALNVGVENIAGPSPAASVRGGRPDTRWPRCR